jgi:hypothetical protein
MRPVSVGKNLVPNVKTTMFTIPTKHDGLWNLLHAYNGTASAKNFTVWWYDKSQNVEVAIITDYPLAAKSYLQFGGDGKYVVLEEGDEVRVQVESGASNAVCVCTVELFPKIAAQQFQDFGF